MRALSRLLTILLKPQTSSFGEVFEQFIILECLKLAAYFHTEYRFSYLSTKDNAEIDLIVERPGLPLLLIEIKSSRQVRPSDLTTFMRLIKDFKPCEAVCFSNDTYRKKLDSVTVIPWQEGVKEFFAK